MNAFIFCIIQNAVLFEKKDRYYSHRDKIKTTIPHDSYCYKSKKKKREYLSPISKTSIECYINIFSHTLDNTAKTVTAQIVAL